MDILIENKTSAMIMQPGRQLSGIMHLHKEIEVVYVLEGRAVAYADKNSYLLNPGDTFIAFPNQVHYYGNERPGNFMVLIFSADSVYSMGKTLLKSIPESNFIPAKRGEGLKAVMDKINSLDSKSEYYQTLLNGYINVMMGLILPQLTLKTVNAQNNTAFKSVVSFCSQNFKEDITLDYIAEQLHLSKYYISHIVNKKLNQNLNEYINNLRVGEACNLLKETDAKIADISEDVGFGTIRSFNRAFKQVMGLSPVEYREQIASLKKSI